ncbi:MAG: GOLPH3/VPS74 family protein [Streptosporangiaceae bacterium]
MSGRGAALQLAGTGHVADDLYLMAHNDVTGRPYLQPRALGLGLAGALLAELMLAGQVDAGWRGLTVVGHASAEDHLSGLVLKLIAKERGQVTAGEWLQFLARTAAHDVAGRLGERGYLAPVSSRRPWRAERWVPVDPDCAFAPLTRARAALDPARPVTMISATLAGLAAACGMGARLLYYAPPGSRRPEETVHVLPSGMRDLIAQTQAAVDSAVLAQRV